MKNLLFNAAETQTSAVLENYLRFLNDTFPDAQTREMFEYFVASVFVHDEKTRQAAFFLGDTNTGKTATVRILQSLFPEKFKGFLTCSFLNMGAWDDSYLCAWALEGSAEKISGKFFDFFTTNCSKNGRPCTARMIVQGNEMPYIMGGKARYDSVLVIPFERRLERDMFVPVDKLCDSIVTERSAISARYMALSARFKNELKGKIPVSALSARRKSDYMERLFSRRAAKKWGF